MRNWGLLYFIAEIIILVGGLIDANYHTADPILFRYFGETILALSCLGFIVLLLVIFNRKRNPNLELNLVSAIASVFIPFIIQFALLTRLH